jgi:hypothetical protein
MSYNAQITIAFMIQIIHGSLFLKLQNCTIVLFYEVVKLFCR